MPLATLLQELRVWLDNARTQAPPKTAIGKALHYLHDEWPRLIRYRDGGAIPIDNNRAENAIRPFVVGRKNWLFSHSVEGVQASANLYSLVQTAKANRREPYQYLRQVFTELPKARNVEQVEALLQGEPQHQPGRSITRNGAAGGNRPGSAGKKGRGPSLSPFLPVPQPRAFPVPLTLNIAGLTDLFSTPDACECYSASAQGLGTLLPALPYHKSYPGFSRPDNGNSAPLEQRYCLNARAGLILRLRLF